MCYYGIPEFKVLQRRGIAAMLTPSKQTKIHLNVFQLYNKSKLTLKLPVFQLIILTYYY